MAAAEFSVSSSSVVRSAHLCFVYPRKSELILKTEAGYFSLFSTESLGMRLAGNVLCKL